MDRPTVHVATLRDATYVMSNLNPDDRAEVECQVALDTKLHEMAHGLLMWGDNFAVREGNQPIAFFGTAPLSAGCLTVWALGTKRIARAVPAINRFMLHEHLPERIAQGYSTMEARSIETHHAAHRWLASMGGEVHGGPFEFGRDREKFLLFRWTSAQIEGITRKRIKPTPRLESSHDRVA